MMDGGEMVIMIGTGHSLEEQEAGLIQGTVLVAVGVGAGVAEVTLEMMVVATTVVDGLITLAVAAADGAQVEDLEAGMLDGVAGVATATVAVAGVQLLLPLMAVTEAGEEQLLVAMVLLVTTTRDGAAPKRQPQRRMGGVAQVGVGEWCAVPAYTTGETVGWKFFSV